jgi:predicted dehydrogenase
MSKEKISIGLIGLGEVSVAHELGYREAGEIAEIRAVCDVNEQVARERGKPYNAKVYKDYHELLEDESLQAVDIMVPHYLHHPIALEALRHQKHVLLEKPMTVTFDEGMELIETARRNNLKFTVAENTRFVTAYMEAERMIWEGFLGEPRLIRTWIYGTEMIRLADKNNWIHKMRESGGGATMDMAPHSLYLIKWLFGEFDDVQGLEWHFISETETPDNSFVSGRLKSGGLFTTQYTETVEVPWGERLEAYGSKGSMIIDQLCNPPFRYYANKDDYDGTALGTVPYDPAGWKLNSMKAEVRAFVEAIREDTPPRLDPFDTCYVIKAIEKAYASVMTGKPVRMDEWRQ